MLAFFISLFGAISSLEGLAKFIDQLSSEWFSFRKAQNEKNIAQAQKDMNAAQTSDEIKKAAEEDAAVLGKL